MKRTLLAGARVFTGESILEDHAVLIEDGRIAGVVPVTDAGATLPGDGLLVPGFVDVQVNGAGGVLFNDTPTVDAALAIAAAMRPGGTTGVLPTLITDEPDRMRRACDAAAAVAMPGSGVLGLHFEGPFISRERAGVHPVEWIREPDEDDLALLTGIALVFRNRGRLLVTVAPECVDDAAIARLAAAGAVVAAGHTGATVERTRQALAAGVRGFTHLFNAMPPIVNRSPGPVAAAMADRDAWCGVIADGVHVHPALLRLLVQVKPGKVLLVSDAMPCAGTDATSFQLHGRTIWRRDGRLTTDDGTLAGADIDLAASVRNCVRELELPLEESLRMASLYPAQYLGLDHMVGRVARGYRADLTLLGPELDVLATWVDGEETWHDRRP